MPVEMIAKTLPKYWEKPLAPGDRFMCEDEHVKLFALTGLAERAPQEQKAPTRRKISEAA